VKCFQDSIKKIYSVVLVHIYKRHICGASPFVSLIFCSIFWFLDETMWLHLLVFLLERKCVKLCMEVRKCQEGEMTGILMRP
jgi:hypothetical protein